MKTLSLFLTLSFLIPAAPVSIFERPAEECALCGHACCCPEMCAAKLKELREAHAGCDTPVSRCKLEKKESASEFVLQEKTTSMRPPAALLALLRPSRPQTSLIAPVHLRAFSPPIFDVPTPPPNL